MVGLGLYIQLKRIYNWELVVFADQEARVLIEATLEVLRTLSNLKLTEREIALLNTVVLFQPGKIHIYNWISLSSTSCGWPVIVMLMDKALVLLYVVESPSNYS